MDWNDVQVELITAKFLTDQGFAETATSGQAARSQSTLAPG